MKLTKKLYFLKPDQSDKYNIDNQNLNWDRVDRILAGMKMRMAIQTILQLLLIGVLWKRMIKIVSTYREAAGVGREG